jgi:hypothetical protein
VPEILTGLGVAGTVAIVLISAIFCLVQPIWALVDCIDSDREKETKVLLSIAIFFTWGLGSLVYGLFFAGSGHLRKFTAVVSLLVAVLTVATFGSCVTAIGTQARRVQEHRAEEQTLALQKAADFRPADVTADAVAPFHALLFVRSGRHSASTSLAEFTLAGPVASSARDVRGGIRHVAHDATRGRTFALTGHDFGALSPQTGEFIEIAVDPSFEFSWPKGVAWDAEAGQAVVLTSHVYTGFLTYEPETSTWASLPAKLRDVPVTGLAYLPEQDLLYAFANDAQATELAQLHRFNRSGSSLGLVALDPPIPLSSGSDTEQAQLHHSSGRLVAVLPPYASDDSTSPDRIFLIDPETGAVSAATSTRVPDTTASR